MVSIIQRPSPNYDARVQNTPPRLVILHYTGMQTGEAALKRLCDPHTKVSAHYVVEEDGRIFQLVEESRRAWHAGKSYWAGERDVNSLSLGIEIVNPGHEFGYRAFPPAQMKAVLELCKAIQARYQLPAKAFWGHSDVAPARKTDPGELFDWAYLAHHGIGVWPQFTQPEVKMTETEAMIALETIGYAISEETPFAAVLTAFQRHFVPQGITGQLDTPTQIALQGLAVQFAK